MATTKFTSLNERLEGMRPNLTPSANPFALLLVKAIEAHHRIDLERVRDAWGIIVAPETIDGEGGPGEDVVIPPAEARIMVFCAIGEPFKKSYAACWDRLKAHPLYAGAMDSVITPHVTLGFTAPPEIQAALRAVVMHIPPFSMSPEAKQDQARQMRMDGCFQAERPKIPANEVNALLRALTYLVEEMAISAAAKAVGDSTPQIIIPKNMKD